MHARDPLQINALSSAQRRRDESETVRDDPSVIEAACADALPHIRTTAACDPLYFFLALGLFVLHGSTINKSAFDEGIVICSICEGPGLAKLEDSKFGHQRVTEGDYGALCASGGPQMESALTNPLSTSIHFTGAQTYPDKIPAILNSL